MPLVQCAINACLFSDPFSTQDGGGWYKFRWGYVPSDTDGTFKKKHTSHSFECAQYKEYLHLQVLETETNTVLTGQKSSRSLLGSARRRRSERRRRRRRTTRKPTKKPTKKPTSKPTRHPTTRNPTPAPTLAPNVVAIHASASLFVACHHDEEATTHEECTKIKGLSSCSVYTMHLQGAPEEFSAMANVHIQACIKSGSTQGDCSKQGCSTIQSHLMMISQGLGSVEYKALQPATSNSLDVWVTPSNIKILNGAPDSGAVSVTLGHVLFGSSSIEVPGSQTGRENLLVRFDAVKNVAEVKLTVYATDASNNKLMLTEFIVYEATSGTDAKLEINTCTASSETSGHPCTSAFNGIKTGTADGWASTVAATPAWVKFKLEKVGMVTGLSIMSGVGRSDQRIEAFEIAFKLAPGVCASSADFLKPASYAASTEQVLGQCVAIADDAMWLNVKGLKKDGGECISQAGGGAASVTCSVRLPFQNSVFGGRP